MQDHAVEAVRIAVDTKERIAQHAREHDTFEHHVKEAPVAEAVAHLTGVQTEFDAEKPPNPQQLHAALDVKDRLAAHGTRLSEEEALWREELDEAVGELQG